LLVRDCFKHSFLSKIFEPLLKQKVSFFLSTFWLGCVFLMLSCISCLYILNINPLLVVLFANIFFRSVVCLFVCWWFPLLYKIFYIWLCPICFFFVLFPLLGVHVSFGIRVFIFFNYMLRSETTRSYCSSVFNFF